MIAKQLSIALVLVFLLAAGAAAQTAPPVLAPIGAQSTDEAVNLNFVVSASDADATTPTMTSSTPLPGTATYVDNGNGTGTFDWTPTFADSGTYQVTFYANDAVTADIDSELVVITVNNVNQEPVLTSIGAQGSNEGVLLSFGTTASDPDGDTPVMSSSTLPGTASYVDNGDGTGSFSWTPTFADAGVYNVTFYAADSAFPTTAIDSELVVVTITNVPQAPVVTGIPDQSVAEGSSFTTINLDDYVSDADNLDSEISWSYSGNTSLSVDITARVATITPPNADWNGAETITFTATDPDTQSDFDAATFTITAVNDPPVVSGIPDQTIDEGSTFVTINLDDYVTDVDDADNTLSWGYTGNTELTVSIVNRVATITIPDVDWNGAETITFTASDLLLATDSDAAVFTVNAVNDAPVVTTIPDQTIDEGSTFATINLDDYVSDIDNLDSEIAWTYSGNTQLTVDITARVATITIPDIDWNGAETITFTATDPGLLSDNDAAVFTVNAVNDPPVVAGIPDQTIDEGSTFATINLDDYVTDVDDPDASISWGYTGNTELTVSIVNRVATITIPDADWNGAETITFTASDLLLATDSDAATFTVNAVNDPPVVATIPDQTIDEGLTFATISLDDYVSDIDNLDSEIGWTYSGNTELTVDITARVATITIPSVDWFGAETITFTATDPGLLFDAGSATFTVNNINDAPVVSDIPDQTIDEGSTFATINLDDYVDDIDNLDNEITWTYSGNTELTVLIVNRIASITIPNIDWNGAETITFTATDPGLLADSDAATFTVNAVNDAPVTTTIPDQTIDEGSSFATINLDDYVSDIDNLDSELSWTFSGNTELSVDITARVATITTPDADWSGAETITFTATDPGLLADNASATFTVNAVNDAPVVADIPDQTIAEGATFTTVSLDGFVSDVDNLDTEMSWSYSGNNELSVSIDVNRIATITLPSVDWNGSETITFTATDPGLLFDSDAAAFTVTGVNDAPVVSTIPDQTVDEGSSFTTINLDDFVADVDNLDSEISWTYSGNTELTVDITARVATISTPNADWNGAETITFTATDPGLLSDNTSAAFTVNAVNDAPVVSTIPDQTVAEGASFTAINLDSYVSDIDNLISELTWSYSGNSELSVSIVNNVAIVTTPDADWNGTETITFTATDPGLLSGSEPVDFTVTGVNDAPVVSNIPDQTVAEGASFATINLDDYVADIDNLDSEMSWSYLGNTELTVSIDVNRVATVTIPSVDWNGAETITFTATDPGLLNSSDGATFTVTATNDAPVVSDIPDQSVAEGATFTTINLDDYVTDADNLDSEITWSYSGNTELTVDITARVATITIPSADWNGSELITFTATDPSLLSNSDPATFTVTAVNDAPVVADIPDQSVAEGATFATINLDSYVSDVDNLASEMSWSSSGNTELTVSIDVNRIATITIPDLDWNGAETITFTATDPGLLSDSDGATMTVTGVNDGPVVVDIPDQTVAEGVAFTTINLDDFVSDIDNLDSEISWSYSGNTDLTVDITARVATITPPDADWNGTETITFTATDPGLLTDFNDATFTITAVNDAPVVASIPDQTVPEGSSFATINLDNYVTDVDNLATEMSWGYSGNTELSVSIVNRLAIITVPDAEWNGAETITFTATDPGLLTGSDAATFTVSAVNDGPVVSDIPGQTIAEGASFTTISLDGYVTDIDNIASEITWTWSGNTALTVSIDVNRIATISVPSADWNGSESITFTATDPGLLSDSDPATFTVTAVNDGPVVTDIPDQTVDEGQTFTTINLDSYVDDVDNLDSEISWNYSGNSELTVSIDVNRVATISIPSPTWNGSETITFSATDPGLLFDSDAATFTVNAVNDAPVVADIPNQTVTEGALFTTVDLDNFVTDEDNLASEMSWSYAGNSELTVSIDVNRVATITIPDIDWNGAETITFTATDPGLLSDSDPSTFTVTAVNDAPIMSDIPNQTIAEGASFATISLDNYVSDVDNLDNEISWSYGGNTELTVSIDINRVATITVPSPTWNGAETITFTATDPGLLTDNDAATFTVSAVNNSPVVSDIPNQTVAEGSSFATISLDNYVTDVDNLDAEITWTYSGNTDLTVSIDASRIATITMPSPDWNGTELITFTATDPDLSSNSDQAAFTVTAINDAPVVADIPDQTVAEGVNFATINLDDYVTDVDNLVSEITWTHSGNISLGVSIVNRVAIITTPSADWSGSEVVTFTATDPGLLNDSDPAQFTITAVNDAPVVADIPDQTIAEGATFATINLDNYVTDVDNLASEMTWSFVGASQLSVSVDVNRVATITIPNVDWNGSETITFTATDPGLLSDTDPASFTVTSVNDAPVVTDIPDQTIAEGSSFASINLDDYVSDVDNLDNEMSWTYAGNTELTVIIDVNRLATITIPSASWNGAETITFTATDPGLLADSDPVAFTVNAVNNPPVVADIPDQTVAEGAGFTTINLDDYVNDIDNADSEISWSSSGATELVVDITARVATITLPSADWNGAETITFTATDPGLLSDSDPATFTVTSVNDAPVVADIPNQTIAEGASFASISLDDYVSDVDHLDNEISWSYSGNTELTVSIDVNRVATITVPSPTWNGAETITFTATDPGLLTDADAATFTVSAVNNAPVVTDIPNQTVAEGLTFTTVNLDDYVSDVDNADSEIAWTYSGNTELIVSIDVNRVATITIPDINWNGSELITFTATDPSLLSNSDQATFTVTSINDAPVVSDIPDQTVAEGVNFTTINLDSYVTDVDNLASEMTWSFAGNIDLTVSIVNRVAIISTPNGDWTGSEVITFTASDPGLLEDSDPAQFTVTAVNDAPVVADIPNQTIAEGASFTTIDLDSYVSDVDNLASEMTWSFVGQTELSVSVDVNRVATITIPSPDWNGVETITFTATDPGLLSDDDPATFTITAVNDAPVVSDIPDQSIAEGSSFATISLDDYVDDIDNLDSEISWTFAGNSALTVDITSRVATITIPSPTWNGAETITFTATDPGLLNDADAATFTVTAVNNAPVVSDIPDQTVSEGSSFVTITLDDYVTDIDDLVSAMTWTYSGNTELSVSIDASRIATIGIPSADWNGAETITFTATDPGLLSDFNAATFTVTAVNDGPVVADIPDQTVAEGASFATISLDDYVSDIDNADSEISWSYSGNTELTVDITARVATITIPSPTWNGSETITFTATDPGLLTSSDLAVFTVTAVNNAPVVADIPDQSIAEGLTFATVDLDSYVTDIDNLASEMSWNYSGNSELTVSIDINRVATITIPDVDWNGVETITFTATDPGLLADSDAATFTVTPVNDAPVVSDIPNQAIAEGGSFATISLDNFVSDVDNLDNEMTWTYTGNSELTVSIDVNRVATITTPSPTWNGAETITFTATDPSLLADSDGASFTVSAVNNAPVVSDIPDQTVAEGSSFATISLDNYVTDVDNLDAEITWTYSGNTELTVSIDASRIATITMPSTDWNGSELITFTATDPSLLSNSDQASFTVTAINDAPVVADIPSQSVAEGVGFATVNLDDYVTDIDNLASEITWTYSGNTDLSVSIVNRVAIITPPDGDWNGSESIIFTATDPGLLNDSDPAQFTITAVNDAPVVSDIPDQTIAEGASFVTINLDNYVSDVDNLASEMTWSFVGTTELSVSLDVNRVATIVIPSADWFGAETITFTATDPGLLSDGDPATFTVTSVNDAPVVTDIPDQTVAEGASFATINLDDYVSDVDNADAELAWTYSGNTELTVTISAARVATIGIPSADWNGAETITFTATDPGLLADSDPVVFTVNAVNNAPVVTDIPGQTVAEGGSFVTITLDDYVSDIDNTDSEMSWSYSGATELAVSIVNRVATITIPSGDWNGAETITFTATDPGFLSDSDPATFTVTSVNDAPVVADIPNQTIAEGASFATISLDDYVSDVDHLDNEISWSYSGNTELTVSIDINRVATITVPSPTWNGAETITFTATDPGLLTDADAATFTVSAVNNAPVVTDIPNQTVAEGLTFTTINLDDYVSDVDNTDDEITWTYSGNTELTVSIDINRVATITIPDINWNGSEAITFTATDPSLLSNSDQATFTVTAINDAPVVSDIPGQTVAEGVNFATVNLDDYVTDLDNLASEITWSYAGNIDLTVSIVNRVAIISTPNGDWTGSEVITFTATDPGLLNDSDPAQFTVTAVNDAPVVADIPNQTIAEGATFATIDLDSYVSDVDNLPSEMTWSFVGQTDLAVSVDVNRVATITIPSPDWNGVETITFTATDPGLLSDDDPATFTITAVNDAPVVADIPDQTIAEGASFATINLDDYVDDIDNADSEISWTFAGNTELTVDITARVATITVPSPTWNGAETITFTATDPGLLNDADAATFTVTAVNNAPVVAGIPDQTISEGSSFVTITLDNYVTDIDNVASDMTWTYSGNTELTVSIDASRIASIGIPDADWNGAETITFTATDPGLLSDFDDAVFTVTAVNDGPVVTDIPDQTVAEGASFATINLDDYVSDIDNADSEINWSYSGNTELTVDITARVATVTIPSPTWNGAETITFTATDPGLLTSSDLAVFTVSAVNNAPVVADIPDQSIAEGAIFTTIDLDSYVTDIDNLASEMSWSYSGNSELTVAIDVNRVATITIPDIDWNGAETITFTATDPGLLADSDAATFTVTPVNDAPVVSDIPGQTIAEGASFTTIALDNYVADIDNLDNEITWTYSGNTELTVSIDINRVATITTPSPTWNGAETVTFTATDPGLLADNDAATFTVSAVNNAPVVADIPDQTVAEGLTFTTINLDDYVSDVDNTDDQITWTYSGNTELTVAIDVNRVATITIPNLDWNGTELITFTATDPDLTSNSDQASFTVTAINDAPVVADIPDQSVAEGVAFATVNLDDYVTDVDNLASEIIWTYSGNIELSVSIVNRVAIITPPNGDWNGSESIIFTATDPGALNDSDPAQFTITAVNDAPVVADIPDQTIAEGATFTTIDLDSFVSDVDNLASEITWTFVGTTELSVSVDVNRVATIVIPSTDWYGAETITFTATDPGLLSDGDPATFTVTSVNDAPVVTDIPDQTVDEGSTFATINLDDYVSDVDHLDDELAWTYSGNTELTVTISAARVATIGIPSADWNGAETITFTATDPGLLADSDAAAFTVTSVNNAPVVTDIPGQTVAEGLTFTTINLDDYVADIDNTDAEMTWSYSGNSALTVSIDVNRVATVTIPDVDWNGSEIITFTATDPGLLSDSDPATFVVTSVNDAPVVTDIPDQTIAEGASFATIALDNYVSDVDHLDNQITWSYSGNTELTVVIDINRVATITAPSPTWNGAETVTFTATDPGLLTDADAATFTVSAVNNAPIVDDIPDQTVAEGLTFTTINLDNYVSDVDNTDAEITWTYSGNTELTVSIDVNRVATITIPDINWNGSEAITFTATDPALLSNSDLATFSVTAINDAPVVADIPNQTVAEGVAFTTINLDSYVTDIDNTPAEMTWSYAGNIELSVSIVNRVAIITPPSADWTGSESVTFTATDPGALNDSDPAVFTVTAVNDAPVVADIPDQTLAEGSTFATIDLDSYVSDVDNLPSEMTWTFLGNSELTISLDVNRVATITIPDINWNGTETITFTATDPGLLSDNDPGTFTITAVNDTPVVVDIPDQTIDEGSTFATINLDDFVSDVDNLDDEMTWTYSGNTELTVDITARVATITIPDINWNGAETITFTATDPGLLFDSDPVTFTVNAVNDAPVVSDIPGQSIAEGATFTTISLDSYVTDIDNLASEMTWTYAGNTELTVSIDVNRVATITIPAADWNGSETITFTATDPGLLSDSDDATFTVGGVNDAPVVTDIPDQTIDEGGNFVAITLDDFVSDVDNADTDMTWTFSGNTELLVDITNRVATITAPDINWNGVETITFTATDPGLLADSNAATFTINPINDPPELAPVGPQTVVEDSPLVFSVTASDIENSPLTLTADSLPGTATFVDNGDGTGDFSWTPGFTESGSYNVLFIASEGPLSDSELVVITVTEVGNQTPVLAAIGAQTVDENAPLNVALSATDADATIPNFQIDGLPTGATFVDNLDGTADFDWTPTFDQAGVYNVTFIATDGAAADSELVAITVNNVNRVPVADAGPDQSSIPANATVTLDGTGSADPDPQSLNYSWTQVGGPAVVLSSDIDPQPTFVPGIPADYLFELIVDDGDLFSAPDTVTINVVNGAPPLAITDLAIQIVGPAIQLDWTPVTQDTAGFAITVDRYVVSRGTSAYFTPNPSDSIGSTDNLTLTFTDADLAGADVVGDTLNQYFYVVEVVDIYGNRSAVSNRVGEFDYQIVTTGTTNFNLVGIPFTNTGIDNAVDLIAAIGTPNVATVNNYNTASQSFESRFAAGFGVNFAVNVGGIYQVNAATATVFSVAGSVPDSGTVSFSIQTTATTDFNFMMIPFEYESSYSVAQDILDAIPGVLNTINRFDAASQSFESRFAAGFGNNFPVKAGIPYQGNAASAGVFPGP